MEPNIMMRPLNIILKHVKAKSSLESEKIPLLSWISQLSATQNSEFWLT